MVEPGREVEYTESDVVGVFDRAIVDVGRNVTITVGRNVTAARGVAVVAVIARDARVIARVARDIRVVVATRGVRVIVAARLCHRFSGVGVTKGVRQRRGHDEHHREFQVHYA